MVLFCILNNVRTPTQCLWLLGSSLCSINYHFLGLTGLQFFRVHRHCSSSSLFVFPVKCCLSVLLRNKGIADVSVWPECGFPGCLVPGPPGSWHLRKHLSARWFPQERGAVSDWHLRQKAISGAHGSLSSPEGQCWCPYWHCLCWPGSPLRQVGTEIPRANSITEQETTVHRTLPSGPLACTCQFWAGPPSVLIQIRPYGVLWI